MVIAAQASAVLAAANEENSSCLAGFVSHQEAGGVAESITGNLEEAHPIGITIISYTATLKSPCWD